MASARSHKLGVSTDPEGRMIYVALVELCCGVCGGALPVGAVFTYHMVGRCKEAWCYECYAFELQPPAPPLTVAEWALMRALVLRKEVS